MCGFALSYWAFNGEDAVAKYKGGKNRPDVVIMDQRLPNMTGVQTMIAILKKDPDARILFVSADKNSEKFAFEKGAKDFLLKPFMLDEFISKLNKCAGVP